MLQNSRTKKTFILGATLFAFLSSNATYWNWKKIEISVDTLSFKNEKNKNDFLFGVASSSHQVEGPDGAQDKIYNNWLKCEKKEFEIEGKKTVPLSQAVGDACRHWKKYKEDIQLMKNLGFNTYKFSISWGKIQPKEKGKLNEQALQHYEDVCKELVKHGIKPIVTLYHYVHPCWFEDKGAFEKEENIKYFVEFTKEVYKRLKKYVNIWFPIGSFIGVYASHGRGMKPPFKHDMQFATEVLKNMLESHVKVYHELKKIDEKPTIGICKSILHIDPYSSWNPLDQLASSQSKKLTRSSIYNFFSKGVFKIWIPTQAKIKYENKQAIGAFDCIGLNYYAGVYISNFKLVPRSDLISTQDDLYAIYPEGLHRGLKEIWDNLAKQFNVPIYVTENGIATDKSQDRDLFFKRHLYAVSKAIADGIDVRGYLVWTLTDCYEWEFGYDRQYGLYSVDRKTQERKLKDGTQFLIDVVKKNNQNPAFARLREGYDGQAKAQFILSEGEGAGATPYVPSVRPQGKAKAKDGTQFLVDVVKKNGQSSKSEETKEKIVEKI